MSDNPPRPPGSVAVDPRTEPPEEPSPGGSVARLVAVVVGIVALGVWFGALSTLVIVAAVVVMIFLHELGHYLTAKWAGMKVTEFFIGFGPKLWGVRRGETEYGLKAIPAGAYVRIIGMSNLEEVDPADEGRTYRQKPYWRRMSVALAGSAMHFLLALLLLFGLLAGYGTYSADRWSVGTISTFEDGPSPAEEVGFQLGDRVVEVDGVRVESFEGLRDYLVDRPGEEVRIVVERDGETVVLTPVLASRGPESDPTGFLGIGPTFDRQPVSPLSAVGQTFQLTGETMVNSVKALVSFFSPANLGDFFSDALRPPDTDAGAGGEAVAPDDNRVVSIVGAVRLGSQAAETGVPQVLELLWILNIFIGVFNLVPLLPLDGGHVAIATYERLRTRKGRRYFADVSKLLPVTYAVVAVLVLVGVTAVYLDVVQPLENPYQ